MAALCGLWEPDAVQSRSFGVRETRIQIPALSLVERVGQMRPLLSSSVVLSLKWANDNNTYLSATVSRSDVDTVKPGFSQYPVGQSRVYNLLRGILMLECCSVSICAYRQVPVRGRISYQTMLCILYTLKHVCIEFSPKALKGGPPISPE